MEDGLLESVVSAATTPPDRCDREGCEARGCGGRDRATATSTPSPITASSTPTADELSVPPALPFVTQGYEGRLRLVMAIGHIATNLNVSVS